MKKLLAMILAALLMAAPLAGCSRKKAELALVTDMGTIDDKSFNQGAWEGLVKYAEEKGISKQYYKPTEKSTEAYLASIDLAVKNGAMVVVCPGYLFEEAVGTAQKTYPDVTFIAIDCTLSEPSSNAVGIVYAEDQVGFLAGYAAVKDGMTKLGFIGGEATATVQKYGLGFVQGAEYAAKDKNLAPGSIQLKYSYTGSFSASPEAQTLAASWYQGGTECIFAAGGAVGNSVMAAAEAAGTRVIGVDVDQSAESETVITSATKGLGTSVYDMLAAYYAGKFPGGKNLTFDVSNNGVSLAMDTAKFDVFTQKDYDTLYAALANNTNNITTGIVNSTSEDGSVAKAGLKLSYVVVEEVK